MILRSQHEHGFRTFPITSVPPLSSLQRTPEHPTSIAPALPCSAVPTRPTGRMHTAALWIHAKRMQAPTNSSSIRGSNRRSVWPLPHTSATCGTSSAALFRKIVRALMVAFLVPDEGGAVGVSCGWCHKAKAEIFAVGTHKGGLKLAVMFVAHMCQKKVQVCRCSPTPPACNELAGAVPSLLCAAMSRHYAASAVSCVPRMVPWRDWDEWYRVKVCSLLNSCLFVQHPPAMCYTSPTPLMVSSLTTPPSRARVDIYIVRCSPIPISSRRESRAPFVGGACAP